MSDEWMKVFIKPTNLISIVCIVSIKVKWGPFCLNNLFYRVRHITFFSNYNMAIVIGPCWTNFCSQKLKRRILATFGFNRTALRTTQPMLHSMYCAVFLKIALSAAKLMSSGHLGAAIWHRWTIICGVSSKIGVTLKDNIFEAIAEIQLRTIDNVLKNWNDRVGYCMASRGSHLNEIIFHYYPEGLYFQIKKEIWENIQ